VSPDLLPHLRRARDLADRRYAEPLDLAALAAAAGCSRYHFLRSFAAAYGETPGRYLTHRRVERASELLRSSTLTVTEVCMLVGFTSLSSFTRRFTEIVGVTPSAYRASLDDAPPVPGCYVLMWSAIADKPRAGGRG
jgi:AraC-like DNA-binding protein